jgi:hypothetical protein
VKAILRRRPRSAVHAESEVSLAKQAQAYAAQLEEDAGQARHAARAAWDQASQAQEKLVAINKKLDETVLNANRLARYTSWLVSQIMERGQTIDRLRLTVQNEPPPVEMNGRV